MTDLNLAVVGAGRIATSYIDALNGCESVRVVGVADIVEDAAQALAARLECDWFATHEQLIGGCSPDAALVCTPPNTHAAITLDLVEQGIHVLCEKPLALNHTEASKMLEAAGSSNVLLTMASKFRYVEDVVHARSLLSSGMIGDLILLENTFASRVDMSQRWNSLEAIAGGGVLIDNGTHSVDVVRFFLGPITDVMAVEGKRAQLLEVEDTAQLFLRGEDGARATVDLSWSLDKGTHWYLEIYGSEGTLQVGWQTSRYRPFTSPDWTQFGTGYDRDRALHDQLADFARAIRTGETPRITAIDALASVDVIEAAYRSLADDHWIAVNSGLPPSTLQ